MIWSESQETVVARWMFRADVGSAVLLSQQHIHTTHILSTPDMAAGAPDLDIIPPDRLSVVLFFPPFSRFLALVWYLFSCFAFFSSCRADCMCSSCLTTTQPAECACSSWSSLSVSPFHGFMVSHTYFPLICLRHPPPQKNGFTNFCHLSTTFWKSI